MPAVLLVSSDVQDEDAVSRALGPSRWQVSVARDFEKAQAALSTRVFTTVICDADIPPQGWRKLLHVAADMEDAPAFILASERPDEWLWAELFNIGGYDLLTKPFDPLEIERVMAGAEIHVARLRRAR